MREATDFLIESKDVVNEDGHFTAINQTDLTEDFYGWRGGVGSGTLSRSLTEFVPKGITSPNSSKVLGRPIA